MIIVLYIQYSELGELYNPNDICGCSASAKTWDFFLLVSTFLLKWPCFSNKKSKWKRPEPKDGSLPCQGIVLALSSYSPDLLHQLPQITIFHLASRFTVTLKWKYTWWWWWWWAVTHSPSHCQHHHHHHYFHFVLLPSKPFAWALHFRIPPLSLIP